MSAASFDSNILIDALNGQKRAQAELERVDELWISRVTWIEVMSRVDDATVGRTRSLLSAFTIDELDEAIAGRAAALRNDRPSLKLPDAVILASAQVRGRILVTRNTKDFPANMPGIRVPYTL
ncbi:MAG: type II toxin-antitoxin system VapC family toxin [Proteobacteria bacterium]|nr:type II toxin-antitoxin system VapC family toxin [Pseudomonadota bacterium]